MNHKGFTLIEVLVALAVIGIAMTALLFSQTNNLRASTRSKSMSEIKASANRVLEDRMNDVLSSAQNNVWKGTINDDTKGKGDEGRQFRFIDYYYKCPTDLSAAKGLRTLLSTVACTGTSTEGSGTTATTLAWNVAGESGVAGEGVITITVSASRSNGASLNLVSRISCFDVVPQPKNDTPAPCPIPEATGGGR